MPSKEKVTYGPDPKERAKRLLDALLAYVNSELPVEVRKFSFQWKDEDSKNPKLVIKTTLQALEYLTDKNSRYEGKLTTGEIRDALNWHFKEFLKILEDHRIKTKGIHDWHFTLTLWSKDRQKNLEQFEIEWEKRRPEKSKQYGKFASERESPENKLYQALLKLDYSKQASLFQGFVSNHQIGACLIHGSDEDSLKLLVKRLILQVPNGNSSNYVMTISFKSNTHNISLDSICQAISQADKIKTSKDISRITKKICKLWESQTVILIFDKIENVDASLLEKFLEKFWQPLADQASKTMPNHPNYRLLLFLLDSEGCTNEWKITCTQNLTPDWNPRTLIKLEKIQPIQQLELAVWLEKELQNANLPPEQNIVTELLQKSRGHHLDMIKEICQRCGIIWGEDQDSWLKY